MQVIFQRWIREDTQQTAVNKKNLCGKVKICSNFQWNTQETSETNEPLSETLYLSLDFCLLVLN